MSLADAFDAMTSTRPYRIGLPLAFAMQEMVKMRGKQFCPLAVDAFARVLQSTGVVDATALARPPEAAGAPVPDPATATPSDRPDEKAAPPSIDAADAA